MENISGRVSKRRRKIKKQAVELLGGKCNKFGYDKCLRALQFHHINPALKKFGIAEKGITRAWSEVVEELKKCILLCANCHAEQEDKLLGCGSTGTADDCYSSI